MDLVANVKKHSLLWVLEIGSMQSGVLSKHDSSYAHRQSVVAWNQYKSSTQHKGSIADQLRTARTKQIEQNRHYIKTLDEIVLFCSHQEIALHGTHQTIWVHGQS